MQPLCAYSPLEKEIEKNIRLLDYYILKSIKKRKREI